MLKTQLYRGRQIVADEFQGIVRKDDGPDPSDPDNSWTHWYGLAGVRVESESGEALTPTITGLEAWTHGYRMTFSSLLEITGFGLLGDFIFFLRAGTDNWGVGPASELYLVCPGEGNGTSMTLEEFLASDRVIPVFSRTGGASDAHGEENFRERDLPNVARFSGDAVWALKSFAEDGKVASWADDEVIEQSADGLTFAVNPDTLGAVGGIARLKVPEHGWRWLFPHDDGPTAALEHLKATQSSDDSFSSMTFSPDMTPAAEKLILYHELAENMLEIRSIVDLLYSDDTEGKPSRWDCNNALNHLEQKIESLYRKA